MASTMRSGRFETGQVHLLYQCSVGEALSAWRTPVCSAVAATGFGGSGSRARTSAAARVMPCRGHWPIAQRQSASLTTRSTAVRTPLGQPLVLWRDRLLAGATVSKTGAGDEPARAFDSLSLLSLPHAEIPKPG